MTYNTINDAATMQPETAGTLLAGRYRVVRQLGQGGMGSVWLAEDTQLDGKQFAIKMLPSILVSNKRAYRQLKDEALVAMQLVHPNIVQIRAFEENNGNPFLVMDYIDGETLDDYLADRGNGEWGTGNGRAGAPRTPQDDPVGRDDPIVPRRREATPPYQGLSESDVLRLLRPIAAALDYAHSKGVVHRDVKPGNVMIAKDGTPYILDFGIAREIQETMTRVTGKLSSGTLLYMSPEQLNGDAPKPAQDIYSFAAMAYECLKGEPPFSRGNIEFQIMNKQPELLGPHIIISGLVMQGLAKKPEDRPKSCAAVLEGRAAPQGGGTQVDRDGGARRPAEPGTGNGRAGAPLIGHPLRGRIPRAKRAAQAVATGVPSAGGYPRPSVGSRDPRDRTGGPRPVAAKGILLATLLAALAMGGAWFYHHRREAARREQACIAAELKAEFERKAETARKAREDAERLQRERAERTAEEERKKEAERLAKEKAEAERKAVEEMARRAAETAARNAATEIRIEAKVQKANVERISDADGFKAKKDALAGSFARAEAFFDGKTGMWNAAAQGFSNYVEQCNALVKLDGERETAVKRKRQAQQAFQTAEKAGAKIYAVTRWNEAVKIWQNAATAFGHMEFASSGDKFASAAEQFGKCLGEVREERERQDAAAAKAKAEQVVRERAELERRQREAEQKRIEAERLRMAELERRRRQQTLQAGTMKTITLPGGVEMRFRWCPPGSFMMGVPDHVYQQYPVRDKAHHVSIDYDFWMGATEITQEQWATIMANTGTGLTTRDLMKDVDNDPRLYKIGNKVQTLRSFYDQLQNSKYQNSKFGVGDWSLKLHDDTDNMPIYYVSWNDAIKFCKQLTAVEKSAGHKIPDGYEYRLPTVEEWEYACRAGCDADLPNGKLYDVAHREELVCPALNSIAWYKGNSGNTLHEVAEMNANNWGLYDMLGNVFEWCMADQLGDEDHASIKGGSFKSSQRDCLPWTRGRWGKGFKMNSLGFRVVIAPILSRKMKD